MQDEVAEEARKGKGEVHVARDAKQVASMLQRALKVMSNCLCCIVFK